MRFDRYVKEHPEFREKIPNNAQIILLLEGDDEFNRWSTMIGNEQAERGQPVIYVTITKRSPAHSRIEELELVTG
jgi:hypothetical protein